MSQGGVATLCALLHSANVFIVEKAALSLSYLSSTCLGNRMAVTQERGQVICTYREELRTFNIKILLTNDHMSSSYHSETVVVIFYVKMGFKSVVVA